MDKDEVKKSPKANLEKHRGTFILIGLLFGVSVLFFAFEWTSATEKVDDAIIVQDILAEEEIEITRRDETPPPPPPPPVEETPEFIQVVEEEVQTKFEINVEDDQSQRQVQTYVPPPPPQPKEEVNKENATKTEDKKEDIKKVVLGGNYLWQRKLL